MENELGDFVTALFADERSISEENCGDLRSYSTLMASQEYPILGEFSEDNMICYENIMAECIMDPELSTRGERTMPEISSEAREKTTKCKRIRTEDVRLADSGWKRIENGYCGNQPRFVYIAPDGVRVTSMKKAIAVIRSQNERHCCV